MSSVFQIFKSETKVSDPIIFYHYTNRDAASSISLQGKIRNQGNGVLLNKMNPESYYRNEILQNNYGFNIPAYLEKNADYCVRVRSKKLIEKKLRKLDLPGDRLLYLYDDDIQVQQTDVYDKPKCEKRPSSPPKMASGNEFQKKQHSYPSTSSCSSTSNYLTEWKSRNTNQFMEVQEQQEIHVNLRSDIDLSRSYGHDYQDGDVTMFAFEWVKEGLERLRKSIGNDVLVTVKGSDGTRVQDKLGNDLSLKTLHLIARSESANTNGVIDFRNYVGISKEVVYSLKDLVRQTVIIGKDQTTNYGGYPRGNVRVPQQEVVYLCDLIGLQFQQQYNSGRLVLVGENLPKGLLDDLIFEQVVKESKPTMEQVRNDRQQRFFGCSGVFFDSKAYVAFVAHDITLAGMALNRSATAPLNFKFLKYGTGYFAGPFSQLLQRFIGEGVAKGLRRLQKLLPGRHVIKRIELPFYDQNFEIDSVCSEHRIELVYSTDDGLKKTHSTYTTATTNCADPHAMTGNKMGFGSIDGAIAENLRGKAVKFSPVINKLMKEVFF